MKRYHPLLVALHWLLAAMIAMGLIMGGKVLSETPNTDPQKLSYLKIHMTMGMIILVLTLVRLATRLLTQTPPHADIGSNLLNKLGTATHFLLYLLVIALAGSGLAIAFLAGLPDIVFGGSGQALPTNFDTLPPRLAHGLFATVLSLALAGHVLAFLYHQFILKDGLISRMWFGSRR